MSVERFIQRAGCLPWLPYEVFLALSNGRREIKLNNKTRTTRTKAIACKWCRRNKGCLTWSRLFEQNFRLAKWSLYRS